MNQYVTGSIIRQLREKYNLTQKDLADRLYISEKTVSKWETGKGYPDISLLEPISDIFNISVTELISGNTVNNTNISANMLKSHFYVCPVCGNIFHSMGEAVIQCHGIQLLPVVEENPDDKHQILIDTVEDDYYVSISHEMTKHHYISFIAAVGPDSIQMKKLYPEGNAEARFNKRAVRKILFFCNQEGMYSVNIMKYAKGN